MFLFLCSRLLVSYSNDCPAFLIVVCSGFAENRKTIRAPGENLRVRMAIGHIQGITLCHDFWAYVVNQHIILSILAAGEAIVPGPEQLVLFGTQAPEKRDGKLWAECHDGIQRDAGRAH